MVQRFGRSPETQRQSLARRTDLDPPIFVHLADAYRKEGLLDDAIRICREGLDAHPSCLRGRLVLARALLERGTVEAARGECERILEGEPAHTEARQLLEAASSRPERAGPGGDRAGDPLASPTLAVLYARQGHPDAAEAIYRQLRLASGSGRQMTSGQSTLERLLAFRDGARRLRAGRLR